MREERLQEIQDSVDFQREMLLAQNFGTLCVDEEQELIDEIERLNNIINEFDKWLLGEKMMFYKGSDDERLIRYGETKNKWLELKGSENSERTIIR